MEEPVCESMGRIRLGYSVSNLTRNLSSGKQLRGSGLPEHLYSERASINIQCLREILGWNYVNRIFMFRVGLDVISKPLEINYEKLLVDLAQPLSAVRVFSEDTGMRLTLHARPCNIGMRKEFIHKVRPHLFYCADVLDAIGTADSVIELHLGFRRDMTDVIKHLRSLPPRILNRIALENDDKWTVKEVVTVAQEAGVQFLYDVFHHSCWPGEFQFMDNMIVNALKAAKALARGKPPLVHISSQAPGEHIGAHAEHIEYKDYARLRRCFADAGIEDCDIMVEAGQKEKAVQDLCGIVMYRNPDWSVVSDGHRI